MNRLFGKLAVNRLGKKGFKNLIISIIILVEVLAIFAVATFAWVETVSSIKIKTNANDPLEVDTYYYTEADIGGEHGTIDMGKYFEPSGDMHFAPCSSVDGDSFYFPKKNGATAFLGAGSGNFRKGNSSDKNTAYMSVTFKLRANTNADFFFYFNGNDNPTFSNQAENMRVSVTAYPEGTSKGDLYDSDGKPRYTKVYANTASTAAVVGNTSGATTATAVEAFSAHKKGSGSSNRLFSVGASETKIVTINVWLQGTTSSSNLASNIAISNFGIISDLTPRHVTLLPTPEWDRSGETQYFYAWCWQSSKGDPDKLFGPLTLDEDEHYSFDYNGTYQKTLFIRAKRNDLREDMVGCWNSTYIHNKTEDTKIPDDPVDPTFIIETINGGAYDSDTGGNKSTGSWHDPATIHVAYAPDQSSTWGTLKATTYVGSTTSTHVIESTNSSSAKHTDTVHAWPGKCIKLEATAKTNYRFEGWYTDAECNTPAPTVGSTPYTSATYTTTAPSTASDITYYAKFVETRTLTLVKYLDGSATNSSTATDVGLFTIGTGTGNTSSDDVSEFARTFDKGSSVSFSAIASSGYSLTDIYTTQTGNTVATSPVTLNDNITYYARFTTNSYNVVTHACYSTDGGSTYTADNSTGGTVQTGTATAGATSTASVKYKSDVTLTATAASNYVFVGWYTAATGGSEVTLTNNKYTLNAAAPMDIYARFIKEQWEIKHGVHGQSGWSSESMTVSNGVATGTWSLTSGDEYSFQITKTVGGSTTWYGDSSKSSVDEVKDTIFNAIGLSQNGGDIFIKAARTGTYNFSYDISTGKLTVTTSATLPTVTLWNNNENGGNGNHETMTRSATDSNIMTCTRTLDEGGDIYFKVNDQTRNIWYTNAGNYEGKTSTTILSSTVMNTSGNNMHIKGHKGTYTFSFNYSTKELAITASYSNITITLWDDTNGTWIKNDSALVYFGSDEGWSGAMSVDGKCYTVSVPSNYCTNAKFQRRVNGNTVNTFSDGNRGYKVGFSARDSGSYWY